MTGPNQALTYSIPSGIANNFFKIDPVTGLVTTTTNEIDREIRSSYIITGNRSYTKDNKSGCEVRFNISVKRVIVRHHDACRMMPDSYL